MYFSQFIAYIVQVQQWSTGVISYLRTISKVNNFRASGNLELKFRGVVGNIINSVCAKFGIGIIKMPPPASLELETRIKSLSKLRPIWWGAVENIFVLTEAEKIHGTCIRGFNRYFAILNNFYSKSLVLVLRIFLGQLGSMR